MPDPLVLNSIPQRLDVKSRSRTTFPASPSPPERCAYQKDLLAVGIREYREAFFKPYRIICRIIAVNVYLLLSADGSREMLSLPERRLLGA